MSDFFKIKFLVLLSITSLFGQAKMPRYDYDLGDWITIKNFNYVTSLTEAPRYIYFGTTGGVIPYQKFDKLEEAAYTTSDGMANDYVTAVYFDNTTRILWAGHRLGVSFLAPTAERWTNCINYGQPADRVTAIGSDGLDIFVLLRNGERLRLDSQTGYKKMNSTNNSSENIQWNVSASERPVEFDGIYTTGDEYWVKNDGYVEDREFREYPWNLKYVNAMNELYGGVFGLGYIVGSEHLQVFTIHPSGVLKNYVNVFDLSERYLWVGSDDNQQRYEQERNGISLYDFKTGKWRYFDDYSIHELATSQILDLDYKDDILLAGTRLGLSVLDMKDDRWRRFTVHDGLYDDVVRTVALNDSIALTGTDFGANIIDLNNWHVSRLRLTKEKTLLKIHKIKVAGDYFWIGTNNGIYTYDKNTRTVRHFDFFGRQVDVDKVIAADCHAITAHGEHVVFKGNNFFMIHNMETGAWKNLPDYSYDSFVYEMDLENDYLWLGTNAGARLLNIKTGDWQEFEVVDGLAGHHVMEVFIDNNWVWFGTDRGLTKYNWRKYVLE